MSDIMQIQGQSIKDIKSILTTRVYAKLIKGIQELADDGSIFEDKCFRCLKNNIINIEYA
jgi:hypothetical protein